MSIDDIEFMIDSNINYNNELNSDLQDSYIKIELVITSYIVRLQARAYSPFRVEDIHLKIENEVISFSPISVSTNEGSDILYLAYKGIIPKDKMEILYKRFAQRIEK